jgi:hypothetical protein
LGFLGLKIYHLATLEKRRKKTMYLVPLSGMEMDSKTVTVTAPVNSLEALLILVDWQVKRESTGGSDLAMRKSFRLRKDKHMCHDPCRKKCK